MESKLGTLVSLTGLKLGSPWNWRGSMQGTLGSLTELKQGTLGSSRESKLDNP
jgi:hypothetical protein